MASRKISNKSDGVSELKFVKHLLNDLKGDLSGKVDRLMMLEELYNEELNVDYQATPGGELVQDVWREARWCRDTLHKAMSTKHLEYRKLVV